MGSFRYPFITCIIFIFFINASLSLWADKNKFSVNSDKFESDEKLKISYLCFRKDNLPTHLFEYLNEQEGNTSNLLFVDDILEDKNGSLKYFLSFATNEEIWGDEDTNLVKSEIKFDPYFRKNSERFLREKAFFEIKQRIKIGENEAQKKLLSNKPIQDKPQNNSVQNVMNIESSNPPIVSQPEEDDETTNLATYLLIAGAVCLAGGLLKKAL